MLKYFHRTLHNISQFVVKLCLSILTIYFILLYSAIFRYFFTYTINVSTKFINMQSMAKKVFYQPFSFKIFPDIECYTINYKKKCRHNMPNSVSRKEIKIFVKYGGHGLCYFFCDG